MTFVKLKDILHKQEISYRKFVGFCDNDFEEIRLKCEISKLVSMQNEISQMTLSELISDVPIDYMVIESRINN
jgi:hypothetical protein